MNFFAYPLNAQARSLRHIREFDRPLMLSEIDLILNNVASNVSAYGLKGDAVSDNSGVMTTMLSTLPTGSTIEFPPGNYIFNSTVLISDKQFNFIGNFATITVTGNFPAFKVSSSEGVVQLGSKNKFINFKFVGNSTGTLQGGIYFYNYGSQFMVDNCEFTGMGGYGIANYISNGQTGAGGIISNCNLYLNNLGIDLQLAGEYVIVDGNNIYKNTLGIQSAAGNVIIDGNNIIRNSNGISFIAGGNNGHSIISNNNINHDDSTTALSIQDTTLGMTIENNHMYGGNVLIKNTTGVTITGGIWDVNVITCDTNIGCVFSGVTFDTGGANTFTLAAGNRPVFINCKKINGDIATQPGVYVTGVTATSNFTLQSSTSLQTFASATTYYISPLYNTVGSRSTVNQIPYKIPVNCRLIGYEISTLQNGTAPDQVATTVSLRLNNTTDTVLNNTVLFNASAWTPNYYSAMNLNQPILSSDSFELKIACPTFTNAPTNALLQVTLFFGQN